MPVAVDYGYSNARIRAMKSYLFDRPFYENLLRMVLVSEITVALEQTPYKRDIEEGTLRFPGALGVEEGLRRNTVSTFQKLLEIVNGEARELAKILLGRWDIQNIKTILRGKHTGSSSEEVLSSLFPAGELSEQVFGQLEKQIDIKAVLDLMVVWKVPYNKPLIRNFPEYARTRNLARLELELDRFYYSYVLERLQKKKLNVLLVREVIQREIDFVNIMTLIRLTREDVEEREIAGFFIDGGKYLKQDQFSELAKARKPEDIVNALHATPFYEALNQGLAKFNETGALSAIERSLEKLMVQKNIRMFRGDPLSIALIIGYIWAKYNEIVNLRIIVRGKDVEMPEEKIREGLAIV